MEEIPKLTADSIPAFLAHISANSVINAVISALFPLIILFALVLIKSARASILESVNICGSNRTISMPTFFSFFDRVPYRNQEV